MLFRSETVLWKDPTYKNWYFGGKINIKAPQFSVLPFPVVNDLLVTCTYALLPLTYEKLHFLQVTVLDELGKGHNVYVLKSAVNQVSAVDYNTKLKQKYRTQIKLTSKDFL